MVITRNPKRPQEAGIIVRIGQKRLSAHMTAATINIHKGGGMRDPCIDRKIMELLTATGVVNLQQSPQAQKTVVSSAPMSINAVVISYTAEAQEEMSYELKFNPDSSLMNDLSAVVHIYIPRLH